jgi:hypothetical protein
MNANKGSPPPTTDRVDRTSFSSIKESHTGGIAQTFTDSKTSSYLRHELSNEEEVFEDDASVISSKTSELERKECHGRMLTNPNSALHGFVCPCDSFKGWKGISLGGRVASKSSGDLKSLGRLGWETKQGDNVEVGGGMTIAAPNGCTPGKSPLESLPQELLGEFITFNFDPINLSFTSEQMIQQI